MGQGRDQTLDPWICSQTRICSRTRYRLRYAARLQNIEKLIWGTQLFFNNCPAEREFILF